MVWEVKVDVGVCATVGFVVSIFTKYKNPGLITSAHVMVSLGATQIGELRLGYCQPQGAASGIKSPQW